MADAAAMFEVVKPGLATTVQDLGRPGYYHLGLPISGAMDRFALIAANRLVGNPDGAAGLEAVFLALHLTQGMQELERYPVSFKSTVAGQVYRHIVLAIKVNGKFGAMGLSRRSTLMFKDFTFETFGDLIADFRDCYEQCFHRLLTVNTGLPISHHDYKALPICWRCLKVKLFKHEWELLHAGLNAFVKDTNKLQHFWERTGKKPNVSQYSHDVPKETAAKEEGDGGEAKAAAPTAAEGTGVRDSTEILDSDEEEDAAEQAAEEAEVVAQAGAGAGMSRSDAAV